VIGLLDGHQLRSRGVKEKEGWNCVVENIGLIFRPETYLQMGGSFFGQPLVHQFQRLLEITGFYGIPYWGILTIFEQLVRHIGTS
jgi:hypothetical protein